jgi:hypothetical protein
MIKKIVLTFLVLVCMLSSYSFAAGSVQVYDDITMTINWDKAGSTVVAPSVVAVKYDMVYKPSSIFAQVGIVHTLKTDYVFLPSGDLCSGAEVHYKTDGTTYTNYNDPYSPTCNRVAVSYYNYGDLAIEPFLLHKNDGDLNGDGRVDISDVLLALRITVGLDVPTVDSYLHGDIAPVQSGVSYPDGKIDITDCLVILQKVVGISTWTIQ